MLKKDQEPGGGFCLMEIKTYSKLSALKAVPCCWMGTSVVQNRSFEAGGNLERKSNFKGTPPPIKRNGMRATGYCFEG